MNHYDTVKEGLDLLIDDVWALSHYWLEGPYQVFVSRPYLSSGGARLWLRHNGELRLV